MVGAGAFYLGFEGGYLGGCSDEDWKLIIHTFHFSRTCLEKHKHGPYLLPAKHYEYFYVID